MIRIPEFPEIDELEILKLQSSTGQILGRGISLSETH